MADSVALEIGGNLAAVLEVIAIVAGIIAFMLIAWKAGWLK